MGVLAELLESMWQAVSNEHGHPPPVELAGRGAVRSAFAVTDFAAAAVATPALALAELVATAGGARPRVRVDRGLASAWFTSSLRPLGWKPPPAWDPLAGDYEASDGWVRLHTNAPRHREAALRVLDLTRVLAGPIATRFLAGYGADVLRLDPPGWEEAIAPEVTLGKRCARLDARSAEGLEQLRGLLAGADVLVHGYRPGALDALGLPEDERQAIRPGLIDVSLDAYGWTGPWRQRRGFDSLVQMSTGIAHRGRGWAGADRPTPLPFQALDQATGYLMAAAVVRGLAVRTTTGLDWRARCSLARTAQLLLDRAGVPAEGDGDGDGEGEGEEASPPDPAIAEGTETTSWGPARRLVAPVAVSGNPMWWERPAVALGSDEARW